MFLCCGLLRDVVKCGGSLVGSGYGLDTVRVRGNDPVNVPVAREIGAPTYPLAFARALACRALQKHMVN
jgi:hypothetical protein